MHIPNEMLQGAICPVTTAVSGVGISLATYFAIKSKERPSALKFASVSAIIFAFQMLNFPVQNGTSGHLLGSALAASLLGAPFGILAISMILMIQSIIFSDGGITTLGANIINMGIIAVSVSYFLISMIKKLIKNSKIGEYVSIITASFISVIAASFICSIELGIGGGIEFVKVIPAMVGIHSIIALFEIVITIALYYVLSYVFTDKQSLSKDSKYSSIIGRILPLIFLLFIAILLSPFASSSPDGLEYIALQLNFVKDGLPTFVTPFSDYSFSLVSIPYISTFISSIFGVVLTFISVFGLGMLVNGKCRMKNGE